MFNTQLEVKRGDKMVMATVEHTAGDYVVVMRNGERFMAKRSMGAWREMTIDEAIARLNILDLNRADGRSA